MCALIEFGSFADEILFVVRDLFPSLCYPPAAHLLDSALERLALRCVLGGVYVWRSAGVSVGNER
jgi:hypothetical protein